MKKTPEKTPNLTLPWVIIAIASMVMFLAFLISMFYEFHTAVFFAVWMWIIAISLFIDGVAKRRQSKLNGNITLIMGVLAVIAGLFVISL